ncbi:MAG: hypothetical protein DRP27_06870 [Thermotogae bacterium]|nr:MAG: hypothetical protein DRP27_06870 [Thermotogota bacterium]
MKIEELEAKNLNDPRRPALKKMVEEKGMLWAVAAMVEGSIGYHSPKSAEIRIRQLMEDRLVQGCERSHAVFAGDSIEEIEHDFKVFQAIEEQDPERAKRIMQIVEKVAKWKHESQVGFGLLYPTFNI